MGKYSVVHYSTTKTTIFLPPEKYPLYGICVYVCGPKKNLNRTLAIDSPIQTFAVGLLVEFMHATETHEDPR